MMWCGTNFYFSVYSYIQTEIKIMQIFFIQIKKKYVLYFEIKFISNKIFTHYFSRQVKTKTSENDKLTELNVGITCIRQVDENFR